MNRNSRPFSKSLAAGAVAMISAIALVACGGGGDEEGEPQKLEFQVNVSGSGTVVTAPKRAEAGPVEVTYGNNSQGVADLQLIRVEGDHTAKEVVDGLTDATSGKPYPDWFFTAGGIGLTEPGEIVTARQVLQPGTYYAFNTESAFNPKTTSSLEVTGEASDAGLDDGAGTVEASEYQFKSEDPLPAGTNEILFANVGAQPHHIIAAKLTGDATAEEVEKTFKDKKAGRPPLDESSTQTTAVIEGGEDQLVSFDLEPGRYAFFCFITDRQGGQRHALKGMVSEIEVEEP